MSLSPFGTARERFTRDASTSLHTQDPELQDLAYLGWDVARAATRLSPAERRALGALGAAALAAMRSGSTRIPVDARLDDAMQLVSAAADVPAVRALLARAREALPSDPVRVVIGRPGDRTPLVLEGDWLYAERMRVLDERF
jgi:hypothetical protein